ncbi:MAG: class I SAM-dependent methyltransferase [Bdellovibrionaceae bacterium]|nr:class I SAM-dependent methyltransferase [Bdellovibrionales bacterium]MCB9085418.1 class I SAM-dependent methyltransferase [Pseudobdellovibrionaceae bacterium]
MSRTAHDDIEILDFSQNKPLQLIRQDRYYIEDEPCELLVDGKRLKVLDFSAFGIAVDSPGKLPSGFEQHETQLIFEGVQVATPHLKLVRHEVRDSGDYKLAFEVIGEPIHVERVQAVRSSREILNEHDQRFRQLDDLPEEARVLIYQLKDWLEELGERVNALAQGRDQTDSRRTFEFENTLIPIVGTYIGQEFPKHYSRLAQPLRDLPPESRKLLVELFRSKLCDIIHQSPFANRVFKKPLGYAGDFEMMNLIYKSENIGESLFARCLQYYSVREPAAQAVRNRADYLTHKLSSILDTRKDEPLKFLSVACGPAREWFNIVSEVQRFNDRKLKVDLIDQDSRALKYAQRQMKEMSAHHPNAVDFSFIHKAIKNVIARGVEGQYDVIYCAGLFDYLSDPVAQLAATRLFASLAPGGTLIIGNFNVANPNEVIMDLALDWHLIYRSEKDLNSLFGHIGGALEIESENLDINLFCVIRKE